MFKIDNVTFDDVGFLECIVSPEIRQRDTAGYSTQTGTRIADVIGTFLNYTITLDFKKYTLAARNQLFEILTEAVEFHTFTLPHNGQTKTFVGWFDGFSEALESMASSQKWGAIQLQIKSRDRYK